MEFWLYGQNNLNENVLCMHFFSLLVLHPFSYACNLELYKKKGNELTGWTMHTKRNNNNPEYNDSRIRVCMSGGKKVKFLGQWRNLSLSHCTFNTVATEKKQSIILFLSLSRSEEKIYKKKEARWKI